MSLLALLRERWYVVLPVIISLPVQLIGLTKRPLWFDELVTAGAVENGFSGLWTHTWEAPLIPYYLLMYLWTFGGALTSDWWLRMSSVVALTGMVGVTAMTGRRLLTPSAGAAAGLFAALNIWVVHHGQNARTYGLTALLVSLTTYFLIAAMSLPDETSRQLRRYALALTLGTVLVPPLLVVLAIHPVILVASGQRALLRPWLGSVALATPAIAFAGWLHLRFGESMHGWLEPPYLSAFLQSPGLVMPPTVLALVCLALALVTRTGRVLLLGLTAGVATIWIAGQVGASFWVGRTLGTMLGILALAGGAAFATFSRRGVTILGAVLVILMTPPITKYQQRTETVRVEKAMLDLILTRGDDSAVLIQKGTRVQDAFHHYARNYEVSFLWPTDPVPPAPYWSALPDWQCQGAEKTLLNEQYTLTYCPEPALQR